MSHLGDRIAALVDGELGHDARDRTLAHLTRCAECRAEADAERGTKSLLAGLEGPEPTPDLVRNLLVLAEPGPPLPPAGRSFPSSSRGSFRGGSFRGGSFRRGGRVATLRPGDRSHRRLRFVTVGALSGFAVVMGTAFAAGGTPQERGTPLSPPIDRYSVEHAVTTGEVLFADPAIATLTGSLGPVFPTVTPGSPGAQAPVPAEAWLYGVPER